MANRKMKNILTFLTGVLFTVFIASAQPQLIKEFKNINHFSGVKLLNNGNIIFSGNDDDNNRHVWVSDGTPTGTKPLSTICPGAKNQYFFEPYGSTNGFYSDGSH